MNSPTLQSYSAIEEAYRLFNNELFEGKLPEVLFTYTRQPRVMGYASIARWTNSENVHVDELSINPEYFAKYPLLEILQTLVHEMVHIWQGKYGEPSRRGYHNKEWANKMNEIGLPSSSTGKPGGDRVGERMSDYTLKDGAFHNACKLLKKKEFMIPWLDRLHKSRACMDTGVYDVEGHRYILDKDLNATLKAAKSEISGSTETFADELDSVFVDQNEEDAWVNGILNSPLDSALKPKARKNTRVKYHCECSAKSKGEKKDNLVWGKPGLRLKCMECEELMSEVDD